MKSVNILSLLGAGLYFDSVIAKPVPGPGCAPAYPVHTPKGPNVYPTGKPPASKPSAYDVYPSKGHDLYSIVSPSRYPASSASAYPVVEPASYPGIYPVPYPVVKPSSYPVVEPSSYPVLEPSSYPVLEPTSYPVLEPSSYPVVESLYPVEYPSSVVYPVEESSSASSVIYPTSEPAVTSSSTQEPSSAATTSSEIPSTTEEPSSTSSEVSSTTQEPSSSSSEVSSTSSTPSATPTACPGFPKTGTIQVYQDGTGVLLGYIRNTYDGQRSHTFGTLANALQVKIDFPGPDCTTPTDIAITMLNMQANSDNFPYLGLVGGSGGYNFNSGQLGYAYMAGTALVAPNSPPAFVAHSIRELGYNAPAETSVWTYNPALELLTMKWTNVDGTPFNAVSFYDPGVDFLGAVADINQFIATFPGEGVYKVNLVFVEQVPPV